MCRAGAASAVGPAARLGFTCQRMHTSLFTTVIICSCIAQISISQIVLDDVADEFESNPSESGSVSSEPTDPYTKMLQWGVDNMDRASVAEQAQAIREVNDYHYRLRLLLFSLKIFL